eukprot:6199262-Pleurochrysis_carterae.AAC.2
MEQHNVFTVTAQRHINYSLLCFDQDLLETTSVSTQRGMPIATVKMQDRSFSPWLPYRTACPRPVSRARQSEKAGCEVCVLAIAVRTSVCNTANCRMKEPLRAS